MNTVTIEHADTLEHREAQIVKQEGKRILAVHLPLWGDTFTVDDHGYLHRGSNAAALRWRVVEN